MTPASDRNRRPPEDTRDLGFGSRVAQRSQARLLNRDGTFNVARRGLPFFRTLNPYHSLLTISWARFFAFVVTLYFATNFAFAAAYFLCGPQALGGSRAATPLARFLEDFFFSVQTLCTIGYGTLSPASLRANLVVTLESLGGLIFFGLFTGLIFARFSRPRARILFSRQAVIAPYHGISAFEFRIINSYRSQLVDVVPVVVLSRLAEREEGRMRVFEELALERPRVTFFPLQLTVVHPIDETSPLRGMTQRDLAEADAEFIVLIDAFDETFSQTVHTRSSYKHHETVVGARFADMFIDDAGGRISVDLRKLHEIERADI